MLTPTELEEKQLLEETVKRREIRSKIVAWSVYRHPHQPPALHHRFLLERLQEVSEDKLVHPKTGDPCRNLIVLMPPGSAKSTYTSVDFPPFYLCRHPDHRVLACSHSGDLIESFSRQCRNSIDAESKVLGYELAKDSHAVKEWSTTKGGQYYCAGVGAGLSGRRAHLGLIDDYIGLEEDANSKTLRDKQYAWYQNDFETRLVPSGIQIIVANRRHWDDLVGRILNEGEDEWVVIKLPYFAKHNDPLGRKPGERLWPEYFTEKHAEKVRKKPSRTQAGLFQQEPSPEQGDLFKSEWLIGYRPEQLPRSLKVYCSSDHACSEKEEADFTVMVPFGVDEGDNIWILPDVYWDIANTGTVVNEMLKKMKAHNPSIWIAETEHIVKSIGPFLRTRMREEHHYTTRLQELSGGRDKSSKAQSISGRVELGKVFFPKFATWWPQAENELLCFPAGEHDDFVDAISVIGRYLDLLQGAQEEKEEKPEPAELTYGWLMKEHRKTEDERDALRRGF